MSIDAFTLSWFIVFVLVIIIAFLANLIIILAILRDKSMHTSTYFYIINVNIADILLVFSCLPERLAEVFGPTDGFHLGMFTCYLIPFLQQVSMHAALAFLLILTIHRCYPAGVPRFLQGDFIRRQIRNYSQTLTILWAFSVLINLPLFAITKYETIHGNETLTTENNTNLTYLTSEQSCFTGASEIWSRMYLILLLICTYLITGIFLIVIYGQVIRILLASKRYSTNPIRAAQNNCDHYRYRSPTNHLPDDQYRAKIIARLTPKGNIDNLAAQSTSSSSPGGSSNRRQQVNISSMPLMIPKPIARMDSNKSCTTSHSAQHLQVIVMLFIVILLYILLLLPYRLLNLLYIVQNEIFQHSFMNDILFQWLLNTVRLLVFLNCALQPITYLIISSRLRQTVIKLLRSYLACFCRCQCSSSSSSLHADRYYKSDTRTLRAYLPQKQPKTNQHPNRQNLPFHGNHHIKQTSWNNLHLVAYPATPLNSVTVSRSPSPVAYPQLNDNHLNRYPIVSVNQLRT